MTRRDLLASIVALFPMLRGLELVKTTQYYDGHTITRYEPRAIVEARRRQIREWERRFAIAFKTNATASNLHAERCFDR